MSRQESPFPVRMPSDLRAWLKGKAENNDRSMNAEIVRTLRKAMKTQNSAKPTT